MSSYSTVYNDAGFGQKFEFTLSTATDGFFGIDYYSKRMYPAGCKMFNGSFVYASSIMKVYRNGVEVPNSKTYMYQSDDYGFVR